MCVTKSPEHVENHLPEFQQCFKSLRNKKRSNYLLHGAFSVTPKDCNYTVQLKLRRPAVFIGAKRHTERAGPFFCFIGTLIKANVKT